MFIANQTHARSASRFAHARKAASALILATAVTACAAEGPLEDEEEGAEMTQGEDEFEVLPYSSSGTAQSNAEIFGVSKGEYDMQLKPVATHECFLTRVSGELDDEWSSAGLHQSTNDYEDDLDDLYGREILNDEGPVWKLHSANGGGNSLSAQAVCVPHSDFVLDEGMVIQSSGLVTALSLGLSGDRQSLATPAAVSSLQYIKGAFNGGGESLEVVKAPQPDLPSLLVLKTERGGITEGAARSFFVGHPGITSVNRSNPVSSSGNDKTRLIPTRDGVCYLTRFSGDFNGSEERVRIMPQMDDGGLEWWVLETHKGRGKAYATAECIYYDQREGCDGNGHVCI